jgi:RHS repeat-associated protein
VKGAVDADRARTGYIGRETDAEHNLGAFGARLYSSEYGRFLAVDKLWEEFRHISPYAYSENNPVMLKDPTGEFPWGIVIGAAVEVASQMIFENRSVSEIDGGRVAIAATAGGLTGGLSAFSSATTRVVGAVAISVAEGAGKRAVSGGGTTAGDVAFDGITGGFIGGTAEVMVSAASKSPAGKMVKETLRREENILAGGRTRAAQVAAVESARDAVGQIGRGVKEEAVLGLVSFGLQGASKIMTKPVSRDNTAVAVKPMITKP